MCSYKYKCKKCTFIPKAYTLVNNERTDTHPTRKPISET